MTSLTPANVLGFSVEKVMAMLGAVGPRTFAPQASSRDLGAAKNLEVEYERLHLPGLVVSVPPPAVEEALPGLDAPGAVLLSDVDRVLVPLTSWRDFEVPGGFLLRLPPPSWPQGWREDGGVGHPDPRRDAVLFGFDPFEREAYFCVWECLAVPPEFIRTMGPGNA